jgi:hypothetical protein
MGAIPMKSSITLRATSVCVGLVFASTNAVSAMCGGSLVPTPHFDKPNSFAATYATSANDVWAAGSFRGGGLLERWNGGLWTRFGLPRRIQALEDIGGTSVSDIWAVGSASDGCGNGDGIAIHWDGSHWAYIPTGLCADYYSNLTSIAVVGPKDVWAVGVYATPGRVGFFAYAELAIHWTGGKQWTTEYVPSDPYTGGFTSVRAVTADDVWAIGTTVSTRLKSWTLMYHWNGRKWRVTWVKSPEVVGSLQGLGVVGKDDVWAVGAQSLSEHGLTEPLIMHWNGVSWSEVSHGAAPTGTSLSSVVAVSANNVWAIGSGTPYGSHVEHWNGSEWSTIATGFPTIPTGFQEALAGVGVIPGNQSVWAIGSIPDQMFESQSLAIDFHC